MSKLKLFSMTALFLLVGCMGSAKLSGSSAESFKASKAKVENQLSASDKIKLEKALKVTILYAMHEKWDHPEKYAKKNFDSISRSIVDNKTFGELVNFAETYLKQNNDEEKKQIKEEIETLNKQKQSILTIDQMRPTNIQIIQNNEFGEKLPFVEVTFTNQSNKEIVGSFMYRIEVYAKSTGKQVASNSTGGTFKEGFSIKPTETYDVQVELNEDAQNLSKLWKTTKYPVTDFAKFDLVIKAYPTEITFKGEEKIERPKESAADLDSRINKLEIELKDLESTKCTLDELELTDE